jgi:hypothetical protein
MHTCVSLSYPISLARLSGLKMLPRPGPHLLQVVSPDADWYSPTALHATHVLAPTELLYLPMGHSLQVVIGPPVVSGTEYFPRSQFVHVELGILPEYLPDWHDMQTVPPPGEYVPMAHWMGAEDKPLHL